VEALSLRETVVSRNSTIAEKLKEKLAEASQRRDE
jgi:hypothetical protein